MRISRPGQAIVLTLVLSAGVAPASAADPAPATLAIVEFDEIDHIYTTEAVPPPGSFQQDAALVAPSVPVKSAAAAPQKASGVFAALTNASTILNGAGSVVAASGEIARTLQIADDVAKVAPIATAMGMAGGKRFDTLLQTYMLPRVSPTGAVMLDGFLAAQAELKNRFPRAQNAPPAEQLVPYAKGALRHYTVAANGWVRINDPATKTITIIKPDAGKSYVLDGAARTYHASDFVRDADTRATSGATAAVEDTVQSLGIATLDGVTTAGFKTHSTMRVVSEGTTCTAATISSTRVEYFAPYRVAPGAANRSPAGQRQSGGCEPAATVKHAGGIVPADQLVMYSANTVEKTTASGTDRYTMVIERGNVQERVSGDGSPFEIPAGYRQT
jgi:hypothetical protein